MSDASTKRYIEENGIKEFSFQHYLKGNSSYGSLVEICVKFTKRLLFGAIKTNVLKYHDFELVVHQIKSILNKRPISLKESLRRMFYKLCVTCNA